MTATTTAIWGGRAAVAFDGSSAQQSKLSVHSGRVAADPPTVSNRRVAWEVTTAGPRVFAQAFDLNLDATAVNRGLAEERGRAIVVRSKIDDGGAFCALAWHLDSAPTAPILVTTLGIRHLSDDARLRVARDWAVAIAFDLLFELAAAHRTWVLGRLPGKRAATLTASGPPAVHIDVEGQPERIRYLEDLFPGRVSPAKTVPLGVTQLRLTP